MKLSMCGIEARFSGTIFTLKVIFSCQAILDNFEFKQV
jgi:hypothetical protein